MELDKLKEIISDQFNVAPEKITMGTSFADDLGADSLDLFQIISEVEESFDLEIPNDVAEKLKTVGDAVEYIRSVTE